MMASRKSNNRPITDSTTGKVVLKGTVLKSGGGGIRNNEKPEKK
jgi:hypothetical protein